MKYRNDQSKAGIGNRQSWQMKAAYQSGGVAEEYEPGGVEKAGRLA